MSDYVERFGGVGRLFSVAGLERLRRAHVCVVGIGGVGSWAVEALARSGIGALTLVDLDEICVTNVNRQIHALDGEIGRAKVEAMARRVAAIHPECRVTALPEFFTEDNAERILAAKFDFILEAIDVVPQKCRLIVLCRSKGIPLVTTGGAGGRRDPTKVRVADLSRTSHDALLQQTRRSLRQDFGFPTGEEWFGVDCVFTPELPVYAHRDGTVCATKEEGSELRLDCHSGYGTAAFVTGTFGFVAAGVVVRKLAANSR